MTLTSTPLSRRGFFATAAAVTAAATLRPGSAAAAPAPAVVRAAPAPLAVPAGVDARTVSRWARDTWRSLAAMADPTTGLAADHIDDRLATSSRSGYTSPTNIGGYLWSAVLARDLGILTPGECRRRLAATLGTLARMKGHAPSGMFYNWYDEATGAPLTVWPANGDRVYPFLSSVDNAWLGVGLHVVAAADPSNAKAARALLGRMRWDMFYDAKASRPGGLNHGGFYDAPPPPGFSGFTGNHIGIGPDVWYTNHHYDTCVSETRITTYLGIIHGQIPATAYYATWRTFPGTDDWSWQESRPSGQTRRYGGIDVFEGAYRYRGMKIVPGWGGSMFEELMPDLFIPEASWGPASWGVQHPLHVRAQREHGLLEAGYGYWGFSPAADPTVPNGYREYGVDALGMKPDGYFSDVQNTDDDAGYPPVRPPANPAPTYGEGVVTPHASFLAMMYEPAAAFANLARIEANLGAYGMGGFVDAATVGRAGPARAARRHLALDQAMVMGAIANVACGGALRRYFATADVAAALRPVLAPEVFGASPIV